MSMFIVIEGPDGVGKSTQAERLVRTLQASGRRAVLEREPTGGPIGQLIREMTRAGEKPDPKTLALLFAADRQEHSRRIQALLDEGAIVVSDRYALSTAIYQGAVTLRRDVGAWADGLSMFACAPDLTIVLHASFGACDARRSSRGRSADVFERDDVQGIVHDAYARAETFRWGDTVRWVSSAGSVDDVAMLVLAEVEAKLSAVRRAQKGG